MRSHTKIFFLFNFLLGSFIFSGVFGSANFAQAALTCQVRNGACVGAETALLRMSDTANAHAGLEGRSVYPYRICCEDNSLAVTISSSCAAPSDVFLRLSASNNAHVDSLGSYANNACISVDSGPISCDYQNGSCIAPAECLASISADTNAHIGACGVYLREVCCDISSPLTCSLSLAPSSILSGDSSTLSWVTTGAASVSIDNGVVSTALSDSEIVSPIVDTTYTLTAIDADGNSTTCSETITIIVPPVCNSFISSPSSIPPGDSSTLTWATTDAASVSIDNGVVSTALSDSEAVFPTFTTVYTLTATNADGTVTCSAMVTIIQPSPPSGGHMKLRYFDKDIVKVFNDASLFLLGVVGKLVLLFIIVGGVYYVFSGSDSKKQESAKKIITYALLGLILILLSYGIISKVSEIGTGGKVYISNTSISPISGPPGTIFIIKATITSSAGVNPATTKASIQSPDETEIASVNLFDDGAHNDGAAGDSVYGNSWDSTVAPLGPYFVDISACDTAGSCKEAENI